MPTDPVPDNPDAAPLTTYNKAISGGLSAGMLAAGNPLAPLFKHLFASFMPIEVAFPLGDFIGIATTGIGTAMLVYLTANGPRNGGKEYNG